MIREGKKLPVDILSRLSKTIKKISEDKDVVALYLFGSFADSNITPLSDLDFAILLSYSLTRQERFQKGIDLIGVFNETLHTNEVDLVILNDDPIRFSYNILKKGKLLYCRDKNQLIDFLEKTNKIFLDFKSALDNFDRVFLEGIGYHG